MRSKRHCTGRSTPAANGCSQHPPVVDDMEVDDRASRSSARSALRDLARLRRQYLRGAQRERSAMHRRARMQASPPRRRPRRAPRNPLSARRRSELARQPSRTSTPACCSARKRGLADDRAERRLVQADVAGVGAPQQPSWKTKAPSASDASARAGSGSAARSGPRAPRSHARSGGGRQASRPSVARRVAGRRDRPGASAAAATAPRAAA